MKFHALLFSLSLAAAISVSDNSNLDKRGFNVGFLSRLTKPLFKKPSFVSGGPKSSPVMTNAAISASRAETAAAKNLFGSWRRADKRWQDALYYLEKKQAAGRKVSTTDLVRVKQLEKAAKSLNPSTQVKVLSDQAAKLRIKANNIDIIVERYSRAGNSQSSPALQDLRNIAQKYRQEASKKANIVNELKRVEELDQRKLLGFHP